MHVQESDPMCNSNRFCKCRREKKKKTYPNTTTRPVHSVLCVALRPSVFASYFSKWVFVLTVPRQTVTAVDPGATLPCGRPSCFEVLSICRKNEFPFNIFTYTFVLSDLKGSETAWPCFYLCLTEKRGEKSLVKKCDVAWLIPDAGRSAPWPTETTHSINVCSERLYYTERIWEWTDVGVGE